MAAAGWSRVAVDRYDEESNDVGVGYGRLVGQSPVALTIYVFPRFRSPSGKPMGLDEQFGEERRQIARAYTVESEGDVVSGTAKLNGVEVAGRGIRIVATGPKPLARGVHTFLTTYAYDPWRIKVRVTVLVEDSEAARTATEELLAALHLPPLDPSAPPREGDAPTEPK